MVITNVNVNNARLNNHVPLIEKDGRHGLSQVFVGIFFCHFFESEFNTPGDTLGT